MKQRCRDIIQQGDRLYSARSGLMSLWQEIAEQFYPERADFTTSRALGDDYASHLMTGAPAMARRTMADQLAAMLRPRGKEWYSIGFGDPELMERQAVKDWARKRSAIMRNAMYDRAAKFTRATKEADDDFAAFGQAVLTAEHNPSLNTLLYRTWHLRDTVWTEDDTGTINTVHRKWKITAADMVRRYKDKAPAKVRECLAKESHREFPCRHIIIPFDEYDYTEGNGLKPHNKFNFMSLMVDVENETVLDEKPLIDHQYIIPRWKTVSGSQYAHSPATMIAMPDTRMLQRMTFAIIEAGEKAVTPPLLAVQDAVRSDIDLRAGGITWTDAEYDERLGEVLRPLTQDKSGLSFGIDMIQSYELKIREAFYLDKINLPPMGDAMTATEVRVRTEEYIRAALPLFEPMEMEYNAPLCEKTADILLTHGAFGPVAEWPQELSGRELKFQFTSPLSEAVKQQDSTVFKQSAELLTVAVQLDPSLKNEFDARKAFRNAMQAIGAPLIDEKAADEAREGEAQLAELQQSIAMAGQGAGAAKQVGEAIGALGGAIDPAMMGEGQAA